MNEIRFKLDDIIDEKIVDDIISSIKTTSKKVTIEKLVFWYNGLDEKKIAAFKKKIEKTIDIPINITDRSPRREYVWFDVISAEEANKSQNRYFYVYPNDEKNKILFGLPNFINVASFVEDSNQARRKYYKPKEA